MMSLKYDYSDLFDSSTAYAAYATKLEKIELKAIEQVTLKMNKVPTTENELSLEKRFCEKFIQWELFRNQYTQAVAKIVKEELDEINTEISLISYLIEDSDNGGSVASEILWGSIQGNITNQIDLITLINNLQTQIDNLEIGTISWGSITGNLLDQSDLNDKFLTIDTDLGNLVEELDNFELKSDLTQDVINIVEENISPVNQIHTDNTTILGNGTQEDPIYVNISPFSRFSGQFNSTYIMFAFDINENFQAKIFTPGDTTMYVDAYRHSSNDYFIVQGNLNGQSIKYAKTDTNFYITLSGSGYQCCLFSLFNFAPQAIDNTLDWTSITL